MRIDGVELRWLDLHLRHPHHSAAGVETDRPVVMARVVTDEGEGMGECAALAAPTYSEEYAAGAWAVLHDHLAPRLVGQLALHADTPAWTDVARAATGALDAVVGHPMAKACLEMAVVDAWLCTRGDSLAAALGAGATSVEAGAVIGIYSGVDDLVAAVAVLVADGYRRVKVKIQPGWDAEPLRALRRSFPGLGLQADANASYRPADLGALRALDELDLLCIEQPLPPDDLVDLARLAAALETPVCLDESATSLGRVEAAAALGACDMVCVKAGRLGGVGAAVRLHDWALVAGVPLWCGGMLETGFARSVNVALSALPGFVLPGDLAGGERFLEPDPAGVPAPVAGRVDVHRGPGVGPRPDPASLARVTARSAWITRSA